MKKTPNKNKEYFLTLTIPGGEPKGKFWVVYPPVVYPFEFNGIELFAHPAYSPMLKNVWDKVFFGVSEKKTGSGLFGFCESPKEAIEVAINLFEGAIKKHPNFISTRKRVIDGFTFENGFEVKK